MPADTRDGAGLARGAVLWVHARTQNKRRTKESKKRSRRRVIEEGIVQVGALRDQGCTNRAQSERKISVSKSMYSYVDVVVVRARFKEEEF